MNLQQINEATNHQIVGGGEYMWACYGPNARYLDYANDRVECAVVFDTVNHTIYEAAVSFKDDHVRPYRWCNEEFKGLLFSEAQARGLSPTAAWDNLHYTDLETPMDFLMKTAAMFNGTPVDTRIEVPLDLDNDLILHIALEAHKRDITLNKMVEIVMQEAIDRHESLGVQ